MNEGNYFYPVYFESMISHHHKVIFIHIPKCAGRSISEAFGQPFDHYTASYYQTKHPDNWNEYTVFTTVRNPYQRLVSMYHYLKNEPFHAIHPITNRGNMLPFKHWVLQNMASFTKEFDYASNEGNRETDGERGSAFWFSSQTRRLHFDTQLSCKNIHILRYENGTGAVENFIQHHMGITVNIPHLNSSHSDSRYNYLRYYDDELLDVVNAFQPFATDCAMLNYEVIKKCG